MIQRFNCEKQSYEVLFFNEKEVNAAWIRPKNVKPYSVDPNTETSGDRSPGNHQQLGGVYECSFQQAQGN